MDKQKIPLLAVRLASTLFEFGDGIEVKIIDESFFNGKSTFAVATRDYTIYFNKHFVESSPIEEIFVTAFHETRHSYQFACIDLEAEHHQNLDETKERIALWKKENENYYNSEVKNDPKYLNQDIEMDAIAFAHYLTNKLFGLKTIIPDVIKDKVAKRIKEFKKYDEISNELKI